MDVLKYPLSQNNQVNLEREVFQHGSIGEFITSSLEGYFFCLKIKLFNFNLKKK